MPLTIDHVLSLIPAWQGRPVTAQPLSGGLTNTNYRVDVDGTPYVVRIPGANTDLLAVDRANEFHNTRAAAEAGSAASTGAPAAATTGMPWAACRR